MNIEQKTVASMRGIAIDAINQAKGGHLGMAVGAANITYELIGKHLNFSSQSPKWINRDKFILSAGHGSMAYYSIMHFMGLLSLDDIKSHKQMLSKTPGHPEIDKFEYVDVSTGPLGQGIAMGVGMAIAEKYLAQRYNKEDIKLIDNYTYVLHGDGCLQEGVALEAIQLAGTYKLNKLILIHDYNNVQIDSYSNEVNSFDHLSFFKANNFNVFDLVSDDLDLLDNAIKQAKMSNRPSYIRVRTTIAINTLMENKPKGHHGFLNAEETIEFKKKCGLSNTMPFEYDLGVYNHSKELLNKKNERFFEWQNLYKKYENAYKTDFLELERLINNENVFSLKNFKFKETNSTTRNYLPEILQKVNESNYPLLGGSADLSGSTKLIFKNPTSQFQNFKYGIREFAMAAINNGIYLASNIRTIDSTFLTFADYQKGALRLGALMQIPNVHVYSHDSYLVGGDGPTHQPYDQLPMLRAMENFIVIRPCDEGELLAAFNYALSQKNSQIALILSRQNLRSFNVLKSSKIKSAYFIKKYENADIALLASGSEVELAHKISEKLLKKNIKANVISVPILQQFIKDEKLIKKLELDKMPLFALEASSENMWYQLAKYNKFSAHLATKFGYSAPSEQVYEAFGFSVANLTKEVIKFLRK